MDAPRAEWCDAGLNDEEFLDALFDHVTELMQDGQPVPLDRLLAGRQHLCGRAEGIVAVAHQVAPGRTTGRLPVGRVGGYTLVRELGRGGMGTVYLARQEQLGGRLVAVKMLPHGFAASRRAQDRFAAEAAVVARLRHRHIVAVHDVLLEGGLCAIAMEWVDGLSVGELIERLRSTRESRARRNRPPGDSAGGRSELPLMSEVRLALDAPPDALLEHSYAVWVCRVGIAIGRALAAVHAQRFIHRDVKPSNILLRRDGTPLLSDFGLVRDIDSLVQTVTGGFVGTPAYASPEQLRGEPLTARSDIYSLGATLYHALTLRVAFEGQSTAEILRKQELGRCTPVCSVVRGVSADLQTIIAKAMEPDPERRYATADAMAEDLERLLRLEPIAARRAGPITRVVRLVRRNRRTVLAASLGSVLTLAVALALLAWAVVLPAMAASSLREARLSLMQPGIANQVISSVLWSSRDAAAARRAPPRERLTAALAAYERALRITPWDGRARDEAEVLRVALSRVDGGPPAVPAEWFSAKHPTVAAVMAGASPPVGAVSPAERRLLGLLAFVHGDYPGAIEAWRRLDFVQQDDPLTEGVLGVLHMARGEMALAYPRLRAAYAEFPDAGFLGVYLADAALAMGETDQAERLLAEASARGLADDRGAADRVAAQVQLHRRGSGDPEALAGMLRMVAMHNPVAGLHLARWLHKDGRTREQLGVLLSVADTVRCTDRFAADLHAAAAAWWDAQPTAERRALVRGWLGLEGERGPELAAVCAMLDHPAPAEASAVGDAATAAGALGRLAVAARAGDPLIQARLLALPVERRTLLVEDFLDLSARGLQRPGSLVDAALAPADAAVRAAQPGAGSPAQPGWRRVATPAGFEPAGGTVLTLRPGAPDGPNLALLDGDHVQTGRLTWSTDGPRFIAGQVLHVPGVLGGHAGDLDGDGDDDLLLSVNGSDSAWCVFTDQQGRLSSPQPITGVHGPGAMLAPGVSEGGRALVLERHQRAAWRVDRGPGEGVRLSRAFDGPDGLVGLVPAGKPDTMLAICSGAAHVAVLRSRDGGAEVTSTLATPGWAAQAVASGDVDGDGRPDLVIGYAVHGTVVVLRDPPSDLPPVRMDLGGVVFRLSTVRNPLTGRAEILAFSKQGEILRRSTLMLASGGQLVMRDALEGLTPPGADRVTRMASAPGNSAEPLLELASGPGGLFARPIGHGDPAASR